MLYALLPRGSSAAPRASGTVGFHCLASFLQTRLRCSQLALEVSDLLRLRCVPLLDDPARLVNRSRLSLQRSSHRLVRVSLALLLHQHLAHNLALAGPDVSKQAASFHTAQRDLRSRCYDPC